MEVTKESSLEHLESCNVHPTFNHSFTSDGGNLRPYLEENIEVDAIEEHSHILKKIKRRNIKK